MNNKPLTFLILYKWIINAIYYIGSVYIIGTALLLITRNVFQLSLEIIHVSGLVLLFLYVILGFIVTNRLDKIVMSTNYFKIVTALAYVCLMSYIKGTALITLTHPWVALALTIPFWGSLIVKKRYPKRVSKILFTFNSNTAIEGDLTSLDGIKLAMSDSISKSIKEQYRDKVVIQGSQFRQDAKGNVGGVFNILLKSKVFGIRNTRLTKVNLTFNLK